MFIDEIHSLMGLGSSIEDRNNDAANILKPYLGDGRLKIIGGTTTTEYKILESDKAFARRFIGLEIPELNTDELLVLLDTTIERYNKMRTINIDYPQNIKEEILKARKNIAKLLNANENEIKAFANGWWTKSVAAIKKITPTVIAITEICFVKWSNSF